MTIIKICFSFPIISCLFLAANAQHLEYSAPFAPSSNWVKQSEQPYRQSICLNGYWQFQPQTLPDQFKEGFDPAPVLHPPDDQQWNKTPIRIPSPWNVNSFGDKNGQGGDFRSYPSYPRSWETIKLGWLRKKFLVPAGWKGRSLQLHFEAIAGDAEIFINGKPAGTHFGIFMPFDIDISSLVEFGKENELRIGIRKASLFDKRSDFGRRTYQAGSFWGQHIAGIWQDVYLVSLPRIRVSDVYISPKLDVDTLLADLTLSNEGDAPKTVRLNGAAYHWLPPANASLPGDSLSTRAALEFPPVTIQVPAHSTVHTALSVKVNGRLRLWSPDSPDLYGLIIKTTADGHMTDSKYTRFGWRQTALRNNQFLLNGQPFVLKGDSWHFLGIPQMTRRYAWAWYKTLRDANLNAVRLHAQPYPPLYLDMADEMGILVLDETAVWASDGGPKLNDPQYWKDSEEQLANQIIRDRNHPSVFGWSISNEVMPIVRGVMHDPTGMKDTLLKYYSDWAGICRKLDPSRPWISADGEDDGEGRLPVYIVHYGGIGAMDRAEKNGKPWGVGESGNAYYATPEQVAETNGPRAYTSFLGRMEGVAAASWKSLMAQRERQAIYRSVFNLVWYGLQPLPLGMKDTTRAPTPDDGIFFTSFEEGRPGVQPERLGPYCTTLNPGYDPSLPMYKTWPLFDAIHDASAEPALTTRWAKPATTNVQSVAVLASPGSKLAASLHRTGVPIGQAEKPNFLFIDGTNPPPADQRDKITQTLAAGGTVMVWGASPARLSDLNALLPAPLTLTSRMATSLDLASADPLTAGLTAGDLYFSELHPPEIMTTGLDGQLVYQSKWLLQAANTDWMKWNKQPEYAKTAMVIRSERETKPAGAALILTTQYGGRLLVTTLPPASRLAKVEKMIRLLLTNMGISLGSGEDAGMPLLKSGDIVRTLYCGTWPIDSLSEGAHQQFIDPAKGESFRANATTDGRTWSLAYNENAGFDLDKMKWNGPSRNAVAYLSFWVSSPRPLDDLLVEPDIPTVGLELAADDATQVWLNGRQVLNNVRTGSIDGGKKIVDKLPLRQGWNHFLIKLIHADRGWQFSGRLISNQPDFLETLTSSLEKP